MPATRPVDALHCRVRHGTLQMGVDTLSGQGQWTSLQDPSLTDQWRMFRLFAGGRPGGSCAPP